MTVQSADFGEEEQRGKKSDTQGEGTRTAAVDGNNNHNSLIMSNSERKAAGRRKKQQRIIMVDHDSLASPFQQQQRQRQHRPPGTNNTAKTSKLGEAKHSTKKTSAARKTATANDDDKAVAIRSRASLPPYQSAMTQRRRRSRSRSRRASKQSAETAPLLSVSLRLVDALRAWVEQADRQLQEDTFSLLLGSGAVAACWRDAGHMSATPKRQQGGETPSTASTTSSAAHLEFESQEHELVVTASTMDMASLPSPPATDYLEPAGAMRGEQQGALDFSVPTPPPPPQLPGGPSISASSGISTTLAAPTSELGLDDNASVNWDSMIMSPGFLMTIHEDPNASASGPVFRMVDTTSLSNAVKACPVVSKKLGHSHSHSLEDSLAYSVELDDYEDSATEGEGYFRRGFQWPFFRTFQSQEKTESAESSCEQ